MSFLRPAAAHAAVNEGDIGERRFFLRRLLARLATGGSLTTWLLHGGRVCGTGDVRKCPRMSGF